MAAITAARHCGLGGRWREPTGAIALGRRPGNGSRLALGWRVGMGHRPEGASARGAPAVSQTLIDQAAPWRPRPRRRLAILSAPAAFGHELAETARGAGCTPGFGGVGDADCVLDLAAGTGSDAPPARHIHDWRIVTTEGRAVFGRATLRRAWHRPPYCLTLRLVRAGTDPTHLASARIATTGSFPAFTARATTAASWLLRRGLTDLGGQGIDPPAYAPKGAVATLDWCPGRLRFHARQLQAGLTDQWWSVGVAEHSLATIAATGKLGAVRWVQTRRGTDYLTDPFPWGPDGDVLCGEMPPGGPGRIVALRPRDGGLARHAAIMQPTLPRHGDLSYPCTFTEDGVTYMVPECLDGAGTRIWRLAPDGGRSRLGLVAAGEALADPTLFRHQGLYWIAATRLALGQHDNLCLFYAAALAGPWREHARNPVKMDIAGARSAGAPFLWGDRLIRPAQDCAAAYGAAIALQEVLELTPERYAERTLRRILPDPHGPFPHGLHTLSAYGERSLIDGKRLVPSLRPALHRLQRLLESPAAAPA